jgi:hypothetical protein
MLFKEIIPVRLEAFTATELDKIFSGNKPYQLSWGDPLMTEMGMVSKRWTFAHNWYDLLPEILSK